MLKSIEYKTGKKFNKRIKAKSKEKNNKKTANKLQDSWKITENHTETEV